MYYSLFIDSFLGHLPFILRKEILIYAMLKFEYSKTVSVIVASLGFLCAMQCNYWMGRGLYKILCSFKPKYKNIINQKAYLVRQNKLFMTLIILPTFIPELGAFIILFMGFCRINIKLILIALASKIIFYVSAIYIY